MRGGDAPHTPAVLFFLAVASVFPSPAKGGEISTLPFPRAVVRAIERGRKWLLASYMRPGFPTHGYPRGAEALYLYALLASGEDPGNAFIQKRFRHLAGLPIAKTYSASLSIAALDALHRSEAAAKGQRKPGPIKGRKKAQMERLLRWLLRTRSNGMWTYGPDTKAEQCDHSNTQFAVLSLEIAMRNGLSVPAGVLKKIGSGFARSIRRESTARPFAITSSHSKKQKNKKTPKLVRPGGWTYLRRQPAQKPYLSMTAAGLSSLLVAREGLRRHGRGTPEEVQKAIRSALTWLSVHYRDMARIRGRRGPVFRDYFYTIYSIEKAGDLGGIVRFGPYDWYRTEAAFLLRTQTASGRWGREGAAGFVDTSFSLLFLSRATLDPASFRLSTEPKFRIHKAPRQITGKGAGKSQWDKVYVSELGGFLSTEEYFAHLAATRDSKLLSIGRQVISHCPEEAKPALIPHLLSLIHDAPRDAVRRFATGALKDITGLSRITESACVRWYRLWEDIAAIAESNAQQRADVLLGIIKGPEPVPLKKKALWALCRIGAKWTVGELLPVLAKAPRSLWENLASTLTYLTGWRPAVPVQRRSEYLDQWRLWWSQHGVEPVRRKPFSDLVAALDRAQDPEEAEAAMAALVAAGSGTIEALLSRMQSSEFSFYLVEALERITGQCFGPDPRSWRAWWQERKDQEH